MSGTGRLRALVVVLALVCMGVPAVGHAEADTTPPVLAALTLPASVDAGTTGVDVTVVAKITDDLSGVAALDGSGNRTCADGSGTISSLGFHSPSEGFLGWTGTFTRQSGDEYRAVVRLPRYVAAGTWTLTSVWLADCAGNNRFLNTEQVAALGFPTTFQVTSPESDSAAPTLSALGIAPPTADTSAAGADVTVSASIADDLSGVSAGPHPGCDPNISYVVFRSPSGSIVSGSFERTSGDAYAAVVRLPRFAAAGTWRVEFVALVDCVRNRRELSAADLSALGFPSSFEVTGVTDSTPPVLASFALPAVVRPDADPVASARITDDLSGVVAADGFLTCATYNGVSTSVVVNSPSGVSAFGIFERRTGDEYEARIDLPAPAEEGVWRVAAVFLFDCAGNQRQLGADDLRALGFPSEFRVAAAYDFGGFMSPLHATELAQRSAGSGMAVKFRLGGAQGLDVFDEGFPKVQPVDCATRQPTGDAVPLSSREWVFQELADGVYHYKWKSSLDWRNVCRRLILGFDDGSRWSADVRFR